MKRFFSIFAVSIASIFIFASCSPLISVKANSNNTIDVSFKTGFSAATSKTLKTIAGLQESDTLFHAGDMIQLLTEAGAFNVSAKIPSENEVQANGTLKDLKKTAFYSTGLISNEAALTLTIGPEQITRFYNLLDENSKSYIDMMMIPCLIGEEMNSDDYRMLLSAMYGPTFANELVDGRVTVRLEAPNGKSTVINERLGDLLTSNKEMVWTLEY